MPSRTTELTSPRLAIALRVDAGIWPPVRELRRLVRGALDAAARGSRVPLPAECEVSIVFSDDAHVRRLNGQYRGKDSATNVLSFPAPRMADGFAPMLGDIVLASETVLREADDQGLTLDDHLTHLLVHGFLHLAGYDHEADAEAVAMESLETAILAGLGIADPYGQ